MNHNISSITQMIQRVYNIALGLIRYVQPIDENNIIATMKETEVFAVQAADVAMQAIKEGVARVQATWDEVYAKAKADIAASRAVADDLMARGHIAAPPQEMLDRALDEAGAAVR